MQLLIKSIQSASPSQLTVILEDKSLEQLKHIASALNITITSQKETTQAYRTAIQTHLSQAKALKK